MTLLGTIGCIEGCVEASHRLCTDTSTRAARMNAAALHAPCNARQATAAADTATDNGNARTSGSAGGSCSSAALPAAAEECVLSSLLAAQLDCLQRLSSSQQRLARVHALASSGSARVSRLSASLAQQSAAVQRIRQQLLDISSSLQSATSTPQLSTTQRNTHRAALIADKLLATTSCARSLLHLSVASSCCSAPRHPSRDKRHDELSGACTCALPIVRSTRSPLFSLLETPAQLTLCSL